MRNKNSFGELLLSVHSVLGPMKGGKTQNKYNMILAFKSSCFKAGNKQVNKE